MPSLAVLILLVVTFTQIVSWVGQTVLQELAFSLYSKVFLSSTASKQSTLRKQVLEDKAELGRTSSQDEFAKWAKIKRRVDKGLADLEKLNTTLGSSRTSFAVKFKSLIWTFTTGAQLFLVWWYRKEPVFWLPTGWVPYPVAWVLSFPTAPIGSVSSGAWSAIISRVLLSLEEIVKSLLAPSPASVPGSTPFAAQPPKQAAKIEPITLEHEKLD
ncbi:protein GET1 [Kwoniella heveanensis CBS 569]|uniref:Protein GET1 n=1 Tax=Kwoniella heveanensis BCC8398 TaxID=1296120 RepID=A0A1B9GNW5_9TREE|nr:protein GET1 [Kwoniella heveanensis BCC8398]OCF38671.1 protein GET1 [Kwoniella heveanensis CBS 569]